ncbi:MAG: hypothetical protein HRJ53_04240, partial [Acidobacteria bacterium Pan2503]|nr:hypothetical protein [Candidatus Acidoferrum panamensis]
HTFQKEGRNLQHFCREAIRHMRNLLIARVCGADSELIAATPDQRPAIAKAAALFSEEDLTRFFQILLQTDDDLRRKPDPRVHLEMGLLRLITASRLAPLEELLAELKSGAPVDTSSGTARAASSALRQAATPPSLPSFTPPSKVVTQSFAPAPAQPEASQQFASPSAAQDATPATTPEVKTPNGSKETLRVSGISQEQVAEIKSAIQAQQKFLGELVEHSSGWELEGAELRIYFPPEKRTFAEMIEGREPHERIRTVSSNVLGRAVRVCAKLDSVAAVTAAASGSQELRAQFERDPMVRSMLERFGGKITEVRSRQQEK